MMANSYHVMINDKPTGPYSRLQIGRLLHESTIDSQTPIRVIDQTKWTILGKAATKFLHLYQAKNPDAAPLPTTQPVPSQPKQQAPAAHRGPYEYKVLTQKDKWFTGKFDPDKLEEALNAYAKQGWIVKGVTSAAVAGIGGNRDGVIVILERYSSSSN